MTLSNEYYISCLLHTIEGIIEKINFEMYEIDNFDKEDVVKETGTPAGWFPLVVGYEELPELPEDVRDEEGKRLEIPGELIEYLKEHERINPDKEGLKEIKRRLKNFYEAGQGAKPVEEEKEEESSSSDSEEEEKETVLGARIPIPTETFLEELSVRMEIHPISVYRLLKEGIEKEGWRCISEEKRILEDIFTVIILRLLGHRWPLQIEEGEEVPEWADKDGIIPLVGGAGEVPLVERVRERIREEFPERDSSAIERQFEEVVGVGLEEWISCQFFKRHVSQFKKRPIAWQVESKPGSRRGRKSPPVFSCLVYYHKIDGDILQKISNHYLGKLLSGYRTERSVLERLEKPDKEQESRKAILNGRIEELEDLNKKLREIAEKGFDSKNLEKIVKEESLDKWTSPDGKREFPKTGEEFRNQERKYVPDINDGVRVNIAPLQKWGILAGDVLNKKDIEKAIEDRAEWRCDDRRWCREGKLPMPGWWKKE